MTSVRFCKKSCGFRFGFGFTKLTMVSVFGSVFMDCVLFNVHDARNDILLCWIGPTNCQPKWLRTRSAEIQHAEKYVDCWSYHAARWIVNETTWKTVPKLPKSVLKSVFENRTAETEFSVCEFWDRFGSIFRKPISEIFIGFRTPLNSG